MPHAPSRRPLLKLARAALSGVLGGSMLPADRYAALLPPHVRERLLFDAPAEWTELELQAFWFAGDFGRDFRTTEGETVRMVQFGVWNHEAGPDFSHAAVSLGGREPVSGPIEFDTEARDWERHGHAQNPAYESVILHVYTRGAGAGVFHPHAGASARAAGAARFRRCCAARRPRALPEAKLGACAAPLGQMTEERAREVLLGAAEYRLRAKGVRCWRG